MALSSRSLTVFGYTQAVYTVFVHGIEVYAYHGVSDEERVVGHRYRIDLELIVSGESDETDAITDTVDYGAAAVLAERVLESAQYRTVERLARLIGEAMLAEFDLVDEATVTVSKPLPPAPVIAAEAGARVTTSRA